MSKLSVRSSGRTPLVAGGGKKGARWAALVEESSDSEGEVTVVAVEAVTEPQADVEAPVLRSLMDDPLYAAMSRGDVLWGDLCMREEGWVPEPMGPRAPVAPVVEPVGEDEFWSQPWADRLEMNGGDHYDTAGLSDEEWADCMTWLYANGWYVWTEGRQGFSASPDTLPPRVWIPPRAAAAAAPPCCHHKKEKAPLSAPGSDAGRRRAAPRPIFCNGGEKCKEGCPYVHGDTIPVLNALCQFGDACGKRIVSVGGTPCCRIHPDEGAWDASMVRNRPTA